MKTYRELELEQEIEDLYNRMRDKSIKVTFGDAIMLPVQLKRLRERLQEERDERIRNETRAEVRRSSYTVTTEESPTLSGKQKAGLLAGSAILGFVLGMRK